MILVTSWNRWTCCTPRGSSTKSRCGRCRDDRDDGTLNYIGVQFLILHP